MKIGILEFGDLADVKTTSEVINGVISYAKTAEKLGYSRFWLSEHHPRSVVWSNPLMMIGILCTQTERINVGTGGILGAFHSPYVVFDYIKQLSLMFPNRIDVGIANGNPADNIKKLLLNTTDLSSFCSKKQYEQNIIKLSGLIDQTNIEENIFQMNYTKPSRWLLSSSAAKFDFALVTQSNVCFSTFHSTIDLKKWKEKIIKFKENFYVKYKTYPKVSVAFSGYFSERQVSAERLYKKEFGKTYKTTSNILAGDLGFLEEQIFNWEQLGIDEFVFKDMEVNNRKRKRTLKLISELL